MKRLIIFVFLLGIFHAGAQETGKLHSQPKIPAAALSTLAGQCINSADLANNGSPFIISFWATWCKPCIKELSAIAEVYGEWQQETGVKLVAVSVDDARSSAQVKSLVNGKAWEYEILLDQNSEFRRAMNVSAVPHTFVVNGKGEIVYQHTGYSEGSELELIGIVRKLAETDKKPAN